MKKSALIPLGIFAVLVAFLAIGLGLKPREVPSPFIGKPVPTFKLPELMADSATISPEVTQGQGVDAECIRFVVRIVSR